MRPDHEHEPPEHRPMGWRGAAAYGAVILALVVGVAFGMPYLADHMDRLGHADLARDTPGDDSGEAVLALPPIPPTALVIAVSRGQGQGREETCNERRSQGH